MIDSLLRRLFKHRDIVIDGRLYLRRYFLTPRWLPIRVFLHRIYLPDAGRDLHDHPWDFSTLVLCGGYEELVRDHGVEYTTTWWRWRRGFRAAEHTHRILTVKPNTWTLLFVRRARRMWGFWPQRGAWVSNQKDGWERRYEWVPWREYLGTPNAPDSPEDAT